MQGKSPANTDRDGIEKKQYGPLMEPFFLHHVLPEFKSPHGFLRARVSRVNDFQRQTRLTQNRGKGLRHGGKI